MITHIQELAISHVLDFIPKVIADNADPNHPPGSLPSIFNITSYVILTHK